MLNGKQEDIAKFYLWAEECRYYEKIKRKWKKYKQVDVKKDNFQYARRR